MRTVTVRMRASDLAHQMMAMREWLDSHRYEPARFVYDQNGDAVDVSVEFPVRAAQRPARRLCFAVARGDAYCFGGGGNGSRTGSGLILARMAFRVLMRGDMKQRSLTLLHGSVVRRRGSDGVSGPRF